MMRRREFVTLLGAAAVAWPLAARAQQTPSGLKRIGVLLPFPEGDPLSQARVAALREGLQNAGWSEGRNARFDVRWTSTNPERIKVDAGELAGLRPDVIVTGSNLVTTIASQLISDIPIVFGSASDPLESGLVSSMAHPGGNVTGFVLFESAISGKWAELVKEMAPNVARIGVLNTPDTPATPGYMRVLESAAMRIGLAVASEPVRTPEDIEARVRDFVRGSDAGLIVLSTPLLGTYRKRIIAEAARYRLPAIYPQRLFVDDGGLISYGPDLNEQYRRAAGYVDRILRGEKPGDLPVEFPTKFELVINLKTAKALALTVPPSLLARADEVIE